MTAEGTGWDADDYDEDEAQDRRPSGWCCFCGAEIWPEDDDNSGYCATCRAAGRTAPLT